MIVLAKKTMDIGLDSSFVLPFTSDAGVRGSIPGPVIHFHCVSFYFSMCISLYMSIPPIPSKNQIFVKSCTDIDNI